MEPKALNTTDLFTSFDSTMNEFEQLLSSFNEAEINTVPFEGSWTAAQVAVHVTKSDVSMVRSLNKAGTTAKRQPDEKVAGIEKIFLDFTTKLQSPEFILPEEQTYNRAEVIDNFKQVVDDLRKTSRAIDLAEMIEHPIFKQITKFEILSFVVVHTQRHSHQLKKIRAAIK